MWTQDRDATLLRLWPTMTAGEIAVAMGTTRNAVLGRIHREHKEKCAAKKNSAQGTWWTRKHDATLLRLWPTMTASKIAAEMGTTRNAVLGRYYRLTGNGARYAQTKKAKQKLIREAKRQVAADAIREMTSNLAGGMSRQLAIRTAVTAGATMREISASLGLSNQRISQIAHGRMRKVSSNPAGASEGAA